MGDRKDRMYTPLSTKDRLDALVSSICEQHQLQESTVRDMLSAGWQYHGNKWVKHRGRGVESNLVIFDEAQDFGE